MLAKKFWDLQDTHLCVYTHRLCHHKTCIVLILENFNSLERIFGKKGNSTDNYLLCSLSSIFLCHFLECYTFIKYYAHTLFLLIQTLWANEKRWTKKKKNQIQWSLNAIYMILCMKLVVRVLRRYHLFDCVLSCLILLNNVVESLTFQLDSNYIVFFSPISIALFPW